MTKFWDQFRKNLREAIEQKNWSQRVAAAQFKMTQPMLNGYLVGDKVPKLDAVFRIAHGLGVSLDELFGMCDIKPRILEPDETELLKLIAARFGYDLTIRRSQGPAAVYDELRALIGRMNQTQALEFLNLGKRLFFGRDPRGPVSGSEVAEHGLGFVHNGRKKRQLLK